VRTFSILPIVADKPREYIKNKLMIKPSYFRLRYDNRGGNLKLIYISTFNLRYALMHREK
jgi:hypothetical protein